MKNKRFFLLYLFVLALMAGGCKKYLEAKPDKTLVVPSSIADLQALMDNYSVINTLDPGSGEASADNYYLTNAAWSALSQENYRRLYTWEKDFVVSPNSNDWYNSYRTVYSCNTVLDDIEGFTNAENAGISANVKGQAYFVRAKAFFQSALLWSLAYDPATASKDPGIPLRVNSDFNVASTRASNAETFKQVLSDLDKAVALLPDNQATVYRPGKVAAFGLLSRVYLYMHQFEKSRAYADSCLQLSGALLDYNTLSPGITYPIVRLSNEVIYESSLALPSPISNTRGKIDSDLYLSYDANDLRKVLFFKDNHDGTYGFKGSYEGSSAYFSGVAMDEVYLTRAECRARAGDVKGAMEDLNTLLINRYKTGTLIPLTAGNGSGALSLILTERRKELLMRGLRWMDLKRLNQEGMSISLTRHLNGQEYNLPPNDLRYALAIPEIVIQVSGIPQNAR